MRSRLRLVVATFVTLWMLAWTVFAQPAPVVQWHHSGSNVTRFEFVIDGGTPTNVGLPIVSATVYEYELPSLTAGVHTLVVQACNTNGCTGAAPITIIKMGSD